MTIEIGVREVPEGNEAAAQRKGQESWAGGVTAEMGRENKAEGNEEVTVPYHVLTADGLHLISTSGKGGPDGQSDTKIHPWVK